MSSIIQQRRSSVEIIDVDLFDDTTTRTSTRSGASRAESHHPDTIFLIDSDDDHEVAGPSSGRPLPTGILPLHLTRSFSHNVFNVASRRNRHRLISPPPPQPRGISQIPPVPRVPHRYSGFTSPFPSPPVVRPITQPFAFEATFEAAMGRPHPPVPGPSNANLPVHPNRHRRAAVPYVQLRAEPPSHHTPSLGLGGALISLNHAHRAHQAHEARGPIGRVGHAMRQIYSIVSGRGYDVFAQDPHDDPFDHPARGYAMREVALRNGESADYQPKYSHPNPPEQGFTFDFAPPEVEVKEAAKERLQRVVIDLVGDDDDDDTPIAGPSKTKNESPPSPKVEVSTLLVCARCLDPLYLGGGLVGEDRTKKKIWALRCGHMIDGKCLDVLGTPYETDVDLWAEGKGKGKAREVDEQQLPSASIRSRLRSRRSAAVRLPPPQSSSPLGKRKRPVHAPRIDDTYEWSCPVTGCGRVHVSVHFEESTNWVPEPEPTKKGKGKNRSSAYYNSQGALVGRGAIAVFV